MRDDYDEMDEMEEGDDLESDSEMKERAARNLIKAVQTKNPKKVVKAFSTLYDLCGDQDDF